MQNLRTVQLAFADAFPGLRGVDVQASVHAIAPFLVFTEFHMDRQVFGPHPHAGISVMTYLLPESRASFRNRDSNGDDSIIEPGGLHITQAGRGIHHDEYPVPVGTSAHGFQIWIDHRAVDRLVEPRAMHAAAADIADVVRDGAHVRVLHGAFGDARGPHDVLTPVTLLDVRLEPGARVALPAGAMTFVYGLRGRAEIAGTAVLPQSLTTFAADGEVVEVTAGVDGAHVMFAAGTPTGEPVVYGGPFVMSSVEQMAETKRRYGRGEMGRLEPVN